MTPIPADESPPLPELERLKSFWNDRYRHFSLSESGWLGAGEAHNRYLYRCKEQALTGALKALGLGPEDDFQILDAGCGQGFFANLYHERFPRAGYAGVDISGRVVQHLRSEHPERDFFEGDMSKWRHPSGARFDVIQALEVLHLMLDDDLVERTLENLASQLEPEGHLLITVVPLDETIQVNDYIRHRGRSFFERAFAACGLSPLRERAIYYWMPDGGPRNLVCRKIFHLSGPRLLYLTDRMAFRLRVPQLTRGHDSRMRLVTLGRDSNGR